MEYIRSNLLVAQNERFVINSVYPGGGTMVTKIFGFRFSESLKMRSVEILHCLCEKFLEYPSNLTIEISIIMYLIP